MLLNLDNVSFSYGGQQTLANISFSVDSGENTVLLGMNGEGKTTLLRLICGTLKPDSGTISLGGSDIAKMKTSKRAKQTSYVPQLPRFSDISVFETVLSGRRAFFGLYPSKKDREKAAEALAIMGIESLSEKSAVSLSGGEQKKVAVARALCSDAKLILMDEPTASLDYGSCISLTDTINKISKNCCATFIVTMHDITLSSRFAKKYVLMKNKEIIAYGGAEILTDERLSQLYGFDAELKFINGSAVVLPREQFGAQK